MYIHIGDVIRECRIRKGWSMRELARQSDVTKSTVSRIESIGCGNIEKVEAMLGAMGYELEVVPRSGQ